MGKEMNILSRENFVTFQFDFQHTGPQFRYQVSDMFTCWAKVQEAAQKS
jgi:hypothetical protein